MRRIFEPFFTTRLSGNGLGLATASEIASEHGGGIDVRSVPGAGSCFEVWLPCCSNPERQKVEAPSVPALSGRGETILIVDEDRDRLLREEEVLAALGYEPVGYSEAGDAVAACTANSRRFDAFLVSHILPFTSSLSLAAALHKIAPDRPILLATISAEDVEARALIAAGITEIIQWPLAAGEIAAALTRCLAARQSV
jgi:PleD family two-component response regulator